MVGNIDESVVPIYIIIESVEASCDEQVEKALCDADREVCYGVLIIEQTAFPTSPCCKIFQAKKQEEGGNDQGSYIHQMRLLIIIIFPKIVYKLYRLT
jgi:hypothetical protein